MRSRIHSTTPGGLPRVIAGAAVVAGVTLVLAGCGGVANKPAASGASGSAECGSTISIGTPLPFSGALQEFATNSFQGAQTAVDEINAAGGIKSLGGAKLTLVKGDVGLDAGQATSATTQLVEQGVVAMTGAWLSAQTVPVSAVAQSSKVPLVSQAWADALSSGGNQYYFQPPVRSSVLGGKGVGLILDAAKSAGISYHKVIAVAPNDVANQTQYTAAVRALNAAGVAGAAPSFYTSGLTDATPVVNQVKASGADLILIGGTPADSILLVKALRAAGITAPLASFGGGFAEGSFGKALGDDVNGIMDVTVWNNDLKLSGVAAAAKAYDKKYGTKFMPVEAGETWVAVHDIAAGLEKAASCDPVTLATTLHTEHFTSGQAAAIPGDGGVYFGDAGYNQNAIPVLIQWQNGVPKTIAPSKYATAKFTSGK
jgi:branched-chain amino acid transport system substrate-binding protein